MPYPKPLLAVAADQPSEDSTPQISLGFLFTFTPSYLLALSTSASLSTEVLNQDRSHHWSLFVKVRGVVIQPTLRQHRLDRVGLHTALIAESHKSLLGCSLLCG